MQSVSVIVVSRDRPDTLMLCLNGIAQLDYDSFEVIVVGCPKAQEAVEARDDATHITFVPFDEANISIARNLGIAQAAGDIVAFIDDDAVPEPMWLRHLAGALGDGIDAAGGFVIGRNGISFQWQARSVDQTGTAHDLTLDGTDPQTPELPKGHVLKTEGTNMAVRRDVLVDLGGFDPAFQFYLDETDLNLRLAEAGHRTILVPLAQVHHGFAASPRRAKDRTPKDLTQIAASQQVFLRKHAPKRMRKPAWRDFRKAQRLRLLRMMQRGPLGPDDVMRLMAGLHKGGRLGAKRAFGETPPIPKSTRAFAPFPGRPDAPRKVFSGWYRQRKSLVQMAAKAVNEGAIVSVFILTPTALFHRAKFTKDGFWQQSGGLFGQSNRIGKLFRFRRKSVRVRSELKRLSLVRGVVFSDSGHTH